MGSPTEGPVQLNKGTVIGRRWRIVKKLGEGGCGAVYKVEDVNDKKILAALKAESNFVSGGSVLKLEVQILQRLNGRPHVAQLLQSGKRDSFSYMVMTLLGDSLNNKKLGKTCSVSTQVRIGINVLFGIKQIHDIGFVHRDLKPANVALGVADGKSARFLHILDFGLAREFVVSVDGKPAIRRPRDRALFRGTTRYCSVNTHDRGEQGRPDDLWSLLYMMAEMRGKLPWENIKNKIEIHECKKKTTDDVLLENSPVQLVQFSQHLKTLNYYTRPDYALLNRLLRDVIAAGGFRFTDPYDWEPKNYSKHPPAVDNKASEKVSVKNAPSEKKGSKESELAVPTPVTGKGPSKSAMKPYVIDESNPFPNEEFETNPLGF